jgi:hypothetical protein
MKAPHDSIESGAISFCESSASGTGSPAGMVVRDTASTDPSAADSQAS